MSKRSNPKLKVIPNITIICLVNITVNSFDTTKAIASSDADYSFSLISDWSDCQEINKSYQTVYAFETASFYINICQKDDSYFYLGEAKQNNQPESIYTPHNSIFIPAFPLESGSGFQANNGNVSYLVILPFGKENNFKSSPSKLSEAILTIERNDKLVSIESSLNKYCHQSETALVWDTIKLQPYNSNQVAAVSQQKDIGQDFRVSDRQDRLFPAEMFNSDSRFDFYRIGGELHRLTTCN